MGGSSLSLLFLLFLSSSSLTKTMQQRPSNGSLPAVFVFGDSTVDPGNNDYIDTLFRGDFPPYGRDFKDGIPTGRFTNGRLVTDFFASYAGVKDYVPPYLDPSLSMEELMTGVSFGSAGSGFDPLTAQLTSVISMEKQMEYLREYKSRIEGKIGKEKMKKLMEEGLFIVSAGTNDFVMNYFGVLPIRQQQDGYSVYTYQQYLLHHVQQFIKNLLDAGARKIAIAGLPPMGCVPAVISTNSNNAFRRRECVEKFTKIAINYNQNLQNMLKNMENGSNKIVYIDIYTPLSSMIHEYSKYGFEEASRGCCGSGLLEASFLCNPQSIVCNNPSKYVFWDAIHPSERSYYIIFQAIRSTVDVFLKP